MGVSILGMRMDVRVFFYLIVRVTFFAQDEHAGPIHHQPDHCHQNGLVILDLYWREEA